MSDIRVAWWNLENLFDEQDAVRDPRLAAALRDELEGWTSAVRDRKLDQLASVIVALFDGAGPDLLGVCEAENEQVLQLLANRLTVPGRRYKVLNHRSPDARGIDTSFLYDSAVLDARDPAHQVILKRSATRDLFWAKFRWRADGSEFVALANHWPSRSEGQYESEPFRMLAGETAGYVLGLLTEADPNRPVLLMGDFNDEPFHRSMQEYLPGTRDREVVLRARSPRVWNLMWPLLPQPLPGTFKFETDWCLLDQFLVTRGLLQPKAAVRVVPESVAIIRPPAMIGRNGVPRRFGRPSTKLDPDGFADHFPITVVLQTR